MLVPGGEVFMSIILSYITRDFIAIVADKRETTKYFLGNMQHRDDIVKVHKSNGVIFALSGHTNYINYFMNNLPDFTSIIEFKNYVAKKINEIQDRRRADDKLLSILKFNLHYGYMNNNKPVLHAYFFKPNDPDIIFADVHVEFKQAVASWPDIKNSDTYEIEVASNYPSNIFDVKMQAADIIKRVSKESEYVSEVFDWEYIIV